MLLKLGITIDGLERLNKVIGILKIGYGNIQSIKAIVDRLGYDFKEVEVECSSFDEVTHLIIPGVGNFAKASEFIYNYGLDFKINEFIKTQKPVLGICLGMQLLMKTGYEYKASKGLGYFEGVTKLLRLRDSSVLPHMGWNTVEFSKEHYLFRNIKSSMDFYFAHSYCVQKIDDLYIFGRTFYDSYFPSVIAKNNVIGTQFHPEKSLKNGIKFIDNFCQWDGVC